MNKEEAIKILIQVARLAQKGGLLSLEDANTTLRAIVTLTPQEDKKIEDKKTLKNKE